MPALSGLVNMAESDKLTATILIVSDTASKDPSTDRAGATLAEIFAADGGGAWDVPVTKIVPDDVLEIQRNILQWTDGDDFVNLIITTGGTGFAVKDRTPEVSKLFVLERLDLI